MRCNYCSREEFDLVTEYTRLERKKVWKCKSCGLVFLEQSQDKEEIESFYRNEYRKIKTLPVRTPEKFNSDKVIRNDVKNRTEFILKNFDINKKKILEIGSATGNLLKNLLEKGAKEVVGIELGLEYAEFARNTGISTYTKPLEELKIIEEFDLILAFHTIEHFVDPLMQIGAIYEAIKPNGVFMGEVPNQNDWRITIFDDEVVKRFHYDPNHYYYFSQETLGNYLRKLNFRNIKFNTVERYNSLAQLKKILCSSQKNEKLETVLNRHIFPKDERDEMRVPNFSNEKEMH
ncbi:MAG: class I SAM-dependent methyltransferase, partial [Promethearchaeota archaeon]